jgi:hypothetical protein
MKTLKFEIPTMTDCKSQQRVSNAIRELDVLNVKTERGNAEITFNDTLKKVEIIKVIEETGYIVKY